MAGGALTVGAHVISQVEAVVAHVIPQVASHVIPHREREHGVTGVVLAVRKLLSSERADGSPGGEEKFNVVDVTEILIHWHAGRSQSEIATSLAGAKLTHLAMAFLIAHPAVTSAIAGPRTMDQLEDTLAGVDVALSDEVLDRIDQIVPPGQSIGAMDMVYRGPEIADKTMRRRPAAQRSAT